MKKLFSRWLPLAVLAGVVGVFGWLAVADVTVPRSTVETPIPHDRFSR